MDPSWPRKVLAKLLKPKQTLEVVSKWRGHQNNPNDIATFRWIRWILAFCPSQSAGVAFGSPTRSRPGDEFWKRRSWRRFPVPVTAPLRRLTTVATFSTSGWTNLPLF
jgi:hypothetical protein